MLNIEMSYCLLANIGWFPRIYYTRKRGGIAILLMIQWGIFGSLFNFQCIKLIKVLQEYSQRNMLLSWKRLQSHYKFGHNDSKLSKLSSGASFCFLNFIVWSQFCFILVGVRGFGSYFCGSIHYQENFNLVKLCMFWVQLLFSHYD